MGLWDGIRRLLTLEDLQPLQTRSEDDPSTLAELLARTQPVRLSPWRAATTREAMGVPAVFKAVTLISNTVGVLSMEAYRRELKLPAFETPSIVIRPNPLTTPQEFWRDSAYYKARHGETWWWIAKRDFDDMPMSLIPVDPRQITVTEDPKNLLRPIIEWRGVRIPNEDMRQMMYARDPRNPLRGWGPLQACGAAISVAVEAQEWAANFFAGNPSNTLIKSATDLGPGPDGVHEATVIKNQWMEGASNLPKVIDPGIESVTEIGTDPDKAQLSDVRLFQNGEVALMFSMPPTLLNYAVQGSTITYQNVGQVSEDFLRQCLWPHYLEAMEQTMSDMLTRSTVSRFNVKGLLRADIKTRFEVHGIAIDKGIYLPEQAASEEGYEPGDVENRPVPLAPPSAVPTGLPIQGRTESPRPIRCHKCNRLLVEGATGYVKATCTKTSCKAVTESHPIETRAEAAPTDAERWAPMFAAIAERPIDNHVTIADGAIRVSTPMTIAEGAVHAPVSVSNQPPAPVEPAPVSEPDPREFVLRQFEKGLLPLEFAAKKLGYTPEEVEEIVKLSAKPEPQTITRVFGRDSDGRPMVTRASA